MLARLYVNGVMDGYVTLVAYMMKSLGCSGVGRTLFVAGRVESGGDLKQPSGFGKGHEKICHYPFLLCRIRNRVECRVLK